MNALKLARAAPRLMRGDMEGMAELVPPALRRSLLVVAALQPAAAELAGAVPPRIAADLATAAKAWGLPAELLEAATAYHRRRTGDGWTGAGRAVLMTASGHLAASVDLGDGLRSYAAALYGAELADAAAGELAGAFLLAVLASSKKHLVGLIEAVADVG